MRHPSREIGEPPLLFLCRGYTLSLHRATCSGGEDAPSGTVVSLGVVSFMSLPNLLRAVGVVGLRNIVFMFLGGQDLRKFARNNQAEPRFDRVATTCL